MSLFSVIYIVITIASTSADYTKIENVTYNPNQDYNTVITNTHKSFCQSYDATEFAQKPSVFLLRVITTTNSVKRRIKKL